MYTDKFHLEGGELIRQVTFGMNDGIVSIFALLAGIAGAGQDKTTILICEQCGLLSVYDRNKDKMYCPICGDKIVVSTVTCSYAFKLLLQEMMSLGIAPRLILKDRA